MRDCLSRENHTREERAVYLRPSLHGARRIDVPFKNEKLHDPNQSTLSAMKQTKERPYTHRRTRFNDHPSASSSSHHKQSQRNLLRPELLEHGLTNPKSSPCQSHQLNSNQQSLSDQIYVGPDFPKQSESASAFGSRHSTLQPQATNV
jgi:hypothetical protein